MDSLGYLNDSFVFKKKKIFLRLLRDFRRYLFLFFWCFDGFSMLIRFFKDLEGFLAIARDSLKDYWPSFRYLWDLWELLAFSRGRYGFLRVTQPNFGPFHPVFGHLRPLWRGSRRHFSLLSSSEQFFLLLFRWADRKLLTFLARCFEFYEAFEHFPTLPKMISWASAREGYKSCDYLTEKVKSMRNLVLWADTSVVAISKILLKCTGRVRLIDWVSAPLAPTFSAFWLAFILTVVFIITKICCHDDNDEEEEQQQQQ